MDLSAYGPHALTLAVLSVTGQIILHLVKRLRNGNGNGHTPGDRITLHDLRDDIHEVRDALNTLGLSVAVLKVKVDNIEERMPL